MQDETGFVGNNAVSLASASSVPVQEEPDDPRKKEERPDLPADLPANISWWSHTCSYI